MACKQCGAQIVNRRADAQYCGTQCSGQASRARLKGRGYKDVNGPNRRFKRYGLTEETYNALFEAQGRKCAVCERESSGAVGRDWHIDHDHETGAVRGILCSRCNVGLGMFDDSTDAMFNAIAYLMRSRQVIGL